MSVQWMSKRCLWAALAMIFTSSSGAQEGYALDSPLDDHDESKSIRYFGSAKDERGKLLAEVTILLDTPEASLVFVTDANGRFRGHLPLDTPMQAVKPTCSKAGYVMSRVTKRPGPKSSGRASVQVDCVLRRAS